MLTKQHHFNKKANVWKIKVKKKKYNQSIFHYIKTEIKISKIVKPTQKIMGF